jgi:hypothetical protein
LTLAIAKTNLPSEGSPKSITTLLNFGANTLTSATAYKHGVVTVIECVLSDASSHFIKVGQAGILEIGGTLEMGTGTKVTW